jgi:hypothetical protein
VRSYVSARVIKSNYISQLRAPMRSYDFAPEKIRNQVLYPLSYGALGLGHGKPAGRRLSHSASRRYGKARMPVIGGEVYP